MIIRNTIRPIARFIINKVRHTSMFLAVEEELEMYRYKGVNERYYEYPFGIKNALEFKNKSGKTKVLDAGSSDSPFGPILASLGFKVTGVDIVPWKIDYPNMEFKVEDLKKLSFKDESFDIVTAISTLEHVGLSRYGEEETSEGDAKSFEELYRVLKSNGYFILTVPYGKKYSVHQNKNRIYDKKRINTLLKKFTVKKTEFYAPIDDPEIFRPCTEKELLKWDKGFTDGQHGVICVVAKK